LTTKPLSSIGKQIVSITTFALAKERSLPFHKKDLNKKLIFIITSLKKNKKRRPINLNREEDGVEKLKSTCIREIMVQPTPSFSHDSVYKN
jgi:hypothetical protein